MPKKMTATDAIAKIPNDACIGIVGAGGGLLEPTNLIEALSQRYEKEGSPRNLTLYHCTGLGDRADRGLSPLAKDGLIKRVYGGHWGQSPRLSEMAREEKIEAYNFPQGIMSQLLRAAAAGSVGLLSQVGIGTFIDPRQKGGRLNSTTKEELLSLTTLGGKESIFYPSIFPDVAFIRGTTADEEGYMSMEEEIATLDTLAIAQATHNNGGIVIAQVKRIVKKGTIHPKQVTVPGYLIDILVEVPEQEQLYGLELNRFFAGDYQQEAPLEILPLDERKLIARRALIEAGPGDVANVGVGICDGIGIVAREEGVDVAFTLTVETGPVGGITERGIFFGASVNGRALMDMPAQFDFYHGGGLDICYLSFAQIDRLGNVNVHKFNNQIMGTGGFIDISQNAKKLVFCGTLRAAKLNVEVNDQGVQVIKEGKVAKFIPELEEITFNAREAFRRGQEVLYITERGVFELCEEGLRLKEIAPGIDLKKDILDQMEFEPQYDEIIPLMRSYLFNEGMMDIHDLWMERKKHE